MRAHRRSLTSDLVCALRALYSSAPAQLEIADDPVAVHLLPAELALPVAAFERLNAVALAHRVLGRGSFGLSYGVPLRTAMIDARVREAMASGIDQLVLLGAGLDARAWRLPELASCSVYELDHPLTQAYKRRRIGALSPLAKAVELCAIDFEDSPQDPDQTLIGEVLTAAGFDPSRASLWIWEGVTMYLTPAAIEASLSAIAGLAAEDSVLCITYLPPDFATPMARRLASASARIIGEHVYGELTEEEMAKKLGRLGLGVESDTCARDWAARWWPERERQEVGYWERLVIAQRVSAAG